MNIINGDGTARSTVPKITLSRSSAFDIWNRRMIAGGAAKIRRVKSRNRHHNNSHYHQDDDNNHDKHSDRKFIEVNSNSEKSVLNCGPIRIAQTRSFLFSQEIISFARDLHLEPESRSRR